jgi:hypothetical protein
MPKWTEELIIEELIKIQETGAFTDGFTQKLLKNMKRTDLAHAIDRSGQGLAFFQQKLGYLPKERPKGYWNCLDNVLKEIKPFVINGNMPTLMTLNNKIGGRIANSIAKFGGMQIIAQKLDCKLDHFYQASDGHYLDSAYELIFDEYLYANKIPHTVNQAISPKTLCRYDFKIGDVYIEIWGYEPNRKNSRLCKRYNIKRLKKERIYKHLGLKMVAIEASVFKGSPEQIKMHFDEIIISNGLKDVVNTESSTIIENTIKSCRYWNEDRIKEELSLVVKDLQHFPIGDELLALGLGSLRDAITRHGGLHYFASLLGMECKSKPYYYWNDETIVTEIKKYIEQLGDFPTFRQLKELKQYDIIRAINRNGGIPKYRKMLGYKELVKPHGYYNPEMIYIKVKELADRLGYFPTYLEFREKDKTLCSAFDRYKLSFVDLRNRYNIEKINDLQVRSLPLQCH